jgi:hypothetical protein
MLQYFFGLEVEENTGDFPMMSRISTSKTLSRKLGQSREISCYFDGSEYLTSHPFSVVYPQRR